MTYSTQRIWLGRTIIRIEICDCAIPWDGVSDQEVTPTGGMLPTNQREQRISCLYEEVGREEYSLVLAPT